MSYALVMVEGDTEGYFYEKVKALYKNSARAKIINLEGNFNINNKVIDRAIIFSQAHPNTEFSILICIDNESRSDLPPIDLEYIKAEISTLNGFSDSRVFLYLAVQDIESWFFHSIDEIYAFLKTDRNKRTRKYRPVEAYNHTHLSILFKENDKKYVKGKKLDNFLNKLDINKIRAGSNIFKSFCDKLEEF